MEGNNDHNGRKEYYGGEMGEVIDGGLLPPVHVGGGAAGDDGSKEKSGAEESQHCIALPRLVCRNGDACNLQEVTVQVVP